MLLHVQKCYGVIFCIHEHICFVAIAIKGRRLNNSLIDIEASRTSLEVETCHSLKESRFEALRSKAPDRVLHYTQTKLLRTYPDNLRIDSSNYDPVVCWNQGVQMVRFSCQGWRVFYQFD